MFGGFAFNASAQADRWQCPAAAGLLATLLLVGCGTAVRFPASPMASEPTPAGIVHRYDMTGQGRADYFTWQDASGRVVRIGYDATGDGKPDEVIDLDSLPLADCRHVILILDGVGFDVVEQVRREGRLRLFHPPLRLIATFPSMTDLSLSDVYRSAKCTSYEVVYFDHHKNQRMGGDADYMSLKNEDWAGHMSYRASTIWDPLSYLYPDAIFEKELNDFLKLFDQRDRKEVAAYFVSTAGVSTRQGLEGQRKVLDQMDRLVEQLVWKTRGLVKVTMFSDHGHQLVRAQRVDFQKFLTEAGWRVADRLEGPRDVVPIEYGIITYASFATKDRPGLAAALLKHPGVDLVTYQEGETVVVEKPGAKAVIERRGNQYRYRAIEGDPLDLGPILEQMRSDLVVDADGFAADSYWFERTDTHTYPDAPNRLWRAFNGLVEHVPDVVASLKDGYAAGEKSRMDWLPYVASTHGDLERKSSTAFIMSTADPLMPEGIALRHRDLPALMERLESRPWPPPMGKERP